METGFRQPITLDEDLLRETKDGKMQPTRLNLWADKFLPTFSIMDHWFKLFLQQLSSLTDIYLSSNKLLIFRDKNSTLFTKNKNIFQK